VPWTIAFAVTVLTSHDDAECIHIFGDKPGPKVLQFAKDCLEFGIDGLVCSGRELALLQEHGLADKFKTFVPGGRPKWASTGDQKRTMTPAELALLGADYVVIGRPIMNGPYAPADAARRIKFEMEDALAA
jgi:orotidine-5'-phosphate decarboxylase